MLFGRVLYSKKSFLGPDLPSQTQLLMLNRRGKKVRKSPVHGVPSQQLHSIGKICLKLARTNSNDIAKIHLQFGSQILDLLLRVDFEAPQAAEKKKCFFEKTPVNCMYKKVVSAS
jgi:hypothetical protein